jgi:hypothetical protein
MTLPLGQLVYVASVKSNIHIYAVMTDGATPNLNTITISVSGDDATAIVPAIQGVPGPAGEPQFALEAQPDIYSSPAALSAAQPSLGVGDFGKYWLLINYDTFGNPISSSAYVWWGSFFRVVPFGTQGPPGPVPHINPEVILIDPNETSYVVNTGTVSAPTWTFYLAVPAGQQGPTGSIAGSPDVDESTAPTIGQVLGFNGNYAQGLPVWQPLTIGSINPKPYTVPESAFNGYSGVSSTNQTVCTFAVPANPWAWKPVVFGQIEVFGITLSTTPLLIGVEVLLGDPASGQLVATGYGNAISGVVEIFPQTSSTGASASAGLNTAMTPTNSTAMVPANHTGTAGTLYVNLVNRGYAGVYNFNPRNAQLFVLVCPAQTEGAVSSAIFGPLTLGVTLSAFFIDQGGTP